VTLFQLLATVAIVDPIFAMKMPPRLTADTGLDALTQAIEGYNAAWHNDFADGMCLMALKLVFQYLPRAYANGDDQEAREKMHNAAALSGLGFINSFCTLAHAMGHTFGAQFKIPHGRAVSTFLPYTMEYTMNGGAHRYVEMARFLSLSAENNRADATSLIRAVVELEKTVESTTSLMQMNIAPVDFENAMETMLDHAQNDTQIVASPRIPELAWWALYAVWRTPRCAR